jgi:hypothetical protein
MQTNVDNIFSEEVRVFIADSSMEPPEFNDISGSTISWDDASGWVEFTTQGETTIGYEADWQDIQVNGCLAPVESIITKEGATLSFSIAENNFEAFNNAISNSSLNTISDASGQVGQTVLVVGGVPNTPYKQIALYGKNKSGHYMLYHFPRVRATGKFEKTLAHGFNAVKCEFTCFADPEAPEDGLFTFINMTALAD